MASPEHIVPALGRALEARGYETLTPVQEAVLDPELQAADLIVSAQTGSGKTVAFGLTLAANLLDGAERFAQAGAPVGLVIAPTRELALQVKRELDWLYALAGATVVSCVGGMDSRDERRALERGAHIVVGTPGRLVDHIRRGALKMDQLRAVVLDEADEMLNMGFREELEAILDASPEGRRTLMFSATMPRAIETLARKYQRDAVRVNTVAEREQHLDIDYRALVAASHDAENAIFNVLRYYDATNALVFCATRAAVARMTSRFSNRGFSVVALSGELSQAERSHALQALRDKRAQVCVATDVAARGIDLPELDLVIHAELPKNTEALLHRSGRTGRAGRRGTSVLIVPHKSRRFAERLLKTANIDAQWGEPPTVDEIKTRDNQRLVADPVLSEPVSDDERALVGQLLETYGAEQVAAAFVRLQQKGKAAPEEIAPAPDYVPDTRERREPRERKPREPREAPARSRAPDFENGVWLKVSVGRNGQAEPRWLIPMLCKAGGITKRELGSIRIQERETHVELDPAAVEQFFANVGRDGKLEKSITVRRLEGEPSETSAPPVADTPRAERPAKPKAPAGWTPDETPRDKPEYKPRPKPQAPVAREEPVTKSEPANAIVPSQPRTRIIPSAKRDGAERKPFERKSTEWKPKGDGQERPKRKGKYNPKEASGFDPKRKPMGGKRKPGGKGGPAKTPPSNPNKRSFHRGKTGK